MKRNIQVTLTTMFFALLSITATAQVASNPPYTLEQSVIAGGGGTSADAGNTYSITGAIGQSITGVSSTTPFTIKSGFFTAAPLAPTAATVTIGGRVLTASGRGIRNVLIMMTDSSGAVRMATSTAFGYYTFAEVAAGDTYILSARAKHYNFSQPTRVISVLEETTDINFVAVNAPKAF